MEQVMGEDILTEHQVAEILFKGNLKRDSWKTIQKMARNGILRGKKVGRRWRFHQEAVKDFLLRK